MTAPAPTSTQRIYDAVCELHALEQVATRETVAELKDCAESIARLDARMQKIYHDLEKIEAEQ